jgi:hypothetical protein
MSSTVSLPAHRFWPQSTHLLITEMTNDQCQIFLNDVLKEANKILNEEGWHVLFLEHVPSQPLVRGIDPKLNLLMGIRSNEGTEPIDIFDLKALDEQSLKPKELLIEELIAKVRQHLTAKKTQGIIFSKSGSKFDSRNLDKHHVAIDDKGYLTFNDRRVVFISDKGWSPLKAERLRSYTIVRLVEENDRVRIFDDYDFIRHNEKGMFIDFQLMKVPSEGLGPDQQDGKNYDGYYFRVQRDILSQPLKEKLIEEIHKFPDP